MTALLILGALVMSAAVVLLFLDKQPPVVAAFLGLWILRKSGYAPVSTDQMLFWTIVTLMMVALPMIRGSVKPRSTAGHAYRVVGALAGMACGLAFGYAGIIAGSLLGTLIGGVAYAMTPAGGRRFDVAALKLTVADGYPAAVSFCMVGVAIAALISASNLS